MTRLTRVFYAAVVALLAVIASATWQLAGVPDRTAEVERGLRQDRVERRTAERSIERATRDLMDRLDQDAAAPASTPSTTSPSPRPTIAAPTTSTTTTLLQPPTTPPPPSTPTTGLVCDIVPAACELAAAPAPPATSEPRPAPLAVATLAVALAVAVCAALAAWWWKRPWW